MRFLCLNVGGSGRSSAQTRHCLVSKVVEICQPHVVILQECSLSTNNVIKFFGLDRDRWEITPGEDARVLWDTAKASRIEMVGEKRVEWLISKCIRRSELEDQTLAPWSPRHRSRFVLLGLPGDQSRDWVLIVSWHGPNRGKGLNEKKRKEVFVAFLLLVHEVKIALQSEAGVTSLGVVLAGDFNLGIETAQEGLTELIISTGFVIPRYTVSKRRLTRSVASNRCIDYFAISGVGCKVSSLHLDDQNRLTEAGASRVGVEFIVENCRHLDHDPVMAVIQSSKHNKRTRQPTKRGIAGVYGAQGEGRPLVQPLVSIPSYSHRQRSPHSRQPNSGRSRANVISNDSGSTRCFDCLRCEACTIL